MIDLTPLRHPKQLWDDLYLITHTQIQQLKEKVLASEELDRVDSQKLDSCYVGLKKLLEIEKELRSDKVQRFTDDELFKKAKAAIRQRDSASRARKKAHYDKEAETVG